MKLIRINLEEQKMNKNKMNNIKKHVQGKFFTLERCVRKTTKKYCARLVSETPQYMVIRDMSTGNDIKMNKSTVKSITCGSFSA